MDDSCEIWTRFSIGRTPVLRHAMVAAIVAGAAWIVFFLLDPAKQLFLPPCLVHAFTGFHCPGCGATRALHELAHGHPIAALRLNALVVLGLPLGCVMAVCRERCGLPSWWLWALFVCVVLFGLARNIPLLPFVLLGP
jgi:hypothetical protein